MKRPLVFLLFFCSILCYGQEEQKTISLNKDLRKDSISHRIIEQQRPMPMVSVGTPGLSIFANRSFEEVLKDTVVHVFYDNRNRQKNQPAIFLDSVFLGSNWGITDINPNDISKLNIVEGQVEINSATYNGQIYITTKEKIKRHFDLLSLNQIRNIYLHPSDNNCIFQIDGKIITEHSDTYFVDKNFIFRIFVGKLNIPDKNNQQNIELDMINILLKTKENYDASKIIRIRGSNDL